METVSKPKRTQDELIKYLMDSKKQTIEESNLFFKSKEFQQIKEKLKSINKNK